MLLLWVVVLLWEAGKPKFKLSAYQLFCKDYALTHPYDGGSTDFAEYTSQQALAWHQTLPTQRERYETLAAADRLRFDRDQIAYDNAMDAFEVANERRAAGKTSHLVSTAMRDKAPTPSRSCGG